MKFTAFITSALCVLALSATADPKSSLPEKNKAPSAAQPAQAPDVAAVKVGPDGTPNASFIAAHDRFLKIAKEGKTELLFLGDSITAGWGSKKEIWDKAFGAYTPANFGIGGDRTQHVLWRITHGELEGIKPKTVVLMIGTNNVGADTAEGISKGITAIVKTIEEKQPQANILLLGIFPRGEKAASNPFRDKLKTVNQIISKLNDGKKVHYLDIGEKFLQADGSLSKDIMPDYLHLSAAGYQIWAEAINSKVTELMK